MHNAPVVFRTKYCVSTDVTQQRGALNILIKYVWKLLGAEIPM